MSTKIVTSLFLIAILCLPLMGQEKLYPMRGTIENPVLLTPDRSSVVVEKAFQHKLIVGFPTDDRVSILPDTRTPLVVLWLRVQNIAQRPLDLNTTKFTSVDEAGRSYSSLTPDEAFNRMMAQASDGSIGTKTLRSLSLGRVGGKRTAEDVKEDIVRYSLHSGQVQAGGVKEGMIFFEGPTRKKFTVNITLGDLWSKPIVFSTEKK